MQLIEDPTFMSSPEGQQLAQMLQSSGIVDDDTLQDPDAGTVQNTGRLRTCWKCGNVEQSGINVDYHFKFLECPLCKVACYCCDTHLAMHRKEHELECKALCDTVPAEPEGEDQGASARDFVK